MAKEGPSSWSNLIVPLLQSTASQWIIIFSLIFGGCCSNAWALELTTRHNPHSGTLITFAQYLIVVVTNLRKHFIYEPMMRDRPSRRQVLDFVVQHVRELRLREKRATTEEERVVIEGDTPDKRAEWARDLEERLRKAGILEAKASKPVYQGSLVVVHDELQNAVSSRNDAILKILLSNDLPTTTTVPTICISPSDDYPSRPKVLSTQSLPSNIPLPTPTLWTQLPKIYLRPRKIPIKVWMIQVLLFFAVSLLNNLALGFDVNLAVHIIFRSGGLAANLLMGWLMKGKKYTRAQVVSVVLVTIGVASATLSTKMGKGKGGGNGDYHTTAGGGSISGGSYAIGIALLTIALLLSAAMGLAQEDAYKAYGRHWEEGLFYLHFLGMPMFAFFGRDLLSQFQIANASPPVEISAVSLLRSAQPAVQDAFYIPATPITPQPYPPYVYKYLEKAIVFADAVIPAFTIPSFWIPLGLNILTQLVCVSGVHRLTSRVSSLTVTLILVIRKAVSLGISVLLIQGNKGNVWLWGGAAAVLMGTVMYSVDGARAKRRSQGGTAVEGGDDSKKRR
ncbi:golgi uridine diphosphate-N- acetylglucosamine transporter [Tulasnella sp. UAMH 9824]|nr:golgi uridine diphosphate-N- acetylglucosamine transporter [Tulasnella sp. UAMH 9824]